MSSEPMQKDSEALRRVYRKAGMVVISRALAWNDENNKKVQDMRPEWNQWADNTAYLALAGAVAEYRAMNEHRGLDLSCFALLLRLFVEAFNGNKADYGDYYWWRHVEEEMEGNWQEIAELASQHVALQSLFEVTEHQWRRRAQRLLAGIAESYPHLLDDAVDLVEHAAAVLSGERGNIYIRAKFNAGRVFFTEGQRSAGAFEERPCTPG